MNPNEHRLLLEAILTALLGLREDLKASTPKPEPKKLGRPVKKAKTE